MIRYIFKWSFILIVDLELALRHRFTWTTLNVCFAGFDDLEVGLRTCCTSIDYLRSSDELLLGPLHRLEALWTCMRFSLADVVFYGVGEAI